VTARWPLLAESASDRLRASELPQVGLLLLAALVATLAVSWPGRPDAPNEAWYAVAQTRSVLQALLALGYGIGLAMEGPRRAAGTVVGVVVVALSALPIELVAHAGSVPATPAWWAWVAAPVAVAGQLAIGAGLGVLVRRIRLVALAPLLVPAVVAGAVALDVRMGITVFNPLTAALHVAPAYLVVHAVAAVGGLVIAVAAARRGWRAP
jgi:hypothetical protein